MVLANPIHITSRHTCRELDRSVGVSFAAYAPGVHFRLLELTSDDCDEQVRQGPLFI